MRFLALSGLALLAACATKPPPKSAGGKAGDIVSIPSDPYPSTYRAFPGVTTIIRNAVVYDGTGRKFAPGAVRIENGLIAEIGSEVAIPAGATVIDAAGKFVTPGVIDIHSHLGVYPSPGVDALSDGNEATSPARPEVWAEHSVWPQDPGFSRALAGGVTTLHILPGSANLFGGRGTTLKNVYGRSVQDMKFPGAPYSLKMACGENPKRVYGARNQLPSTRMGNIAYGRQAWSDASTYRRKWEDYTRRAKAGTAKPSDAPRREIANDTLVGVLNGEILIQNHCYRADEMTNMIGMAHEFGYKITAFHHAVESYKVADLLAKEGICSAMWADWYGFKMESYDGIRENIALVDKAGACAIVHSDDANGIQRLNQEAAKAMAAGNRMGMGITPERAWTWLSLNPAKGLGIAARTGSLEAGKMGDVVLWNADPFSVYARPEKVWIDGAVIYDWADRSRRPVADFELGQPGRGDPK
ncbi:imidazolonepropionase related amidohydrolase [Polymorphobacter glacialis]|uniref:Imidazolonepropionase related amidohydrolase n=1 Tax=Sandarakinorhabdus glacialis TaxID=1614636 RepID=A0A916ZVP7_9SPHN|nr:amidohydrolase [Polymorphobacter glacialis]GGE15969.1 imidazolonepropionase related amidohydrolase [Polymorphobacter glacialis]